MLWLAKQIEKKHPNGFLSAVIWGERGIGKTSYQLSVAKDIYMNNGMEKKKAYARANQELLYRPKDVINEIEKYAYGNKTKKLLMIDDASAFLSKYLYFTDRKRTELLQKLFDCLRTACTGLLMSCPSPKNLLKFLKNYSDYSIKIIRANSKWRRIARIYRTSFLPSGMPRIRKRAEDNYSCYIPKDVYENYQRKREKYLQYAVSELKEHIKNKEKKERNR